MDARNALLSQLGGAFDEAETQGYLREKPKAPDEAVIQARRRVIGSYLFLLGYLAKQPAGEAIGEQDDSVIRKAISAFQDDAGLSQDGWGGNQTWNAIQELGSFEFPVDIDRWFVDGEPRPVLKRATYLRLFALGLTKLPPRPETALASKIKESEGDFQNGLAAFVRNARSLQLSDGSLEPALKAETLRVLFDQDRLSEASSEFLNNPDPVQLDRGARNEAYDFIRNTAQIELWLYGYNVRVGNFKRGGPFDRPGKFSLSFSSALHAFATDHDLAEGDYYFEIHGSWSEQDAMEALPWFFERLATLEQDEAPAGDFEDSDRVVDKVLQDKDIKLGVRDSIKSLGARLWDGIKRVGKWIKSLFGKLFDTVKKAAKSIYTNISRFLHESALRVYSHVVAAVRAVADGIDFLKEKVVRGSDPQHMMIFHDGDLDFNLFVNSSANPGTVFNLCERVVLRSEILGIGSRIVSSLGSFFLSILRAGVTTGWFALMLALVRLYKTAKELKEFSGQALTLMNELDDLRVQPV